MTTLKLYHRLLDEYVKRSALIDRMVMEPQKSDDLKLELERLRAKQRKANKLMQKLESSSSSMYENIGLGG